MRTLCEKEKLLVTSNFFFSHRVFYPFGKLSAVFIKSKVVVCKLFKRGSVYNLSFRKGLMLTLFSACIFQHIYPVWEIIAYLFYALPTVTILNDSEKKKKKTSENNSGKGDRFKYPQFTYTLTCAFPELPQ